jgi:ribosomal protein S18 acetylase RimI-like enzyme
LIVTETNQAAPGLKILRATWRDLNELHALEHECFNADAWSLLDLVGVLTLPSTYRIKAVFDEKMVGFLSGEINRSESTGWITTVGVLPEFRKMGIGRSMLRTGEKEMKLKRLCLCVRKSNQPAIELYLSEGYLSIDHWPHYYEDGEDAIVMEKKIIPSDMF